MVSKCDRNIRVEENDEKKVRWREREDESNREREGKK